MRGIEYSVHVFYFVRTRCHIILSNLRKPGEKAYKIPAGFLFNYITCANYTAEIWGWILFTIGTRTLAAGLFTAAGAFQMAEWARGKHKRLQKVSVWSRSCSHRDTIHQHCKHKRLRFDPCQVTLWVRVLKSVGTTQCHVIAPTQRAFLTTCVAVRSALQLFDGQEGREKYPKRWIMFPPLL